MITRNAKTHLDKSVLEDGIVATFKEFKYTSVPPSPEFAKWVARLQSKFQDHLSKALPEHTYQKSLAALETRCHEAFFKKCFAYKPKSKVEKSEHIPTIFLESLKNDQTNYAIFLGANFFDFSEAKEFKRNNSAEIFFLIFDLRKEVLMYGKTWEGRHHIFENEKGVKSLVKTFYESFKYYQKYKK